MSAKRYFLSSDNDGHDYTVEADKRAEWRAWLDLSDDDEKAWEAPPFARRIDSPELLTFENPVEIEICQGCKNEIDPTTCHCGSLVSDHGAFADHSAIPMGCHCGCAKELSGDTSEPFPEEIAEL